MRIAIYELAESLTEKDKIIDARGHTAKERYEQLQEMAVK